jgi:protein-tyrosine-phosphatase
MPRPPRSLPAARWTDRQSTTSATAQVRLMSEFLRSPKFKGSDTVPDPYFGGRQGFELVLDLLEDACEGLLAEASVAQA